MQERTADKFVHRMEERVHVAGDVRSSTTLRARRDLKRLSNSSNKRPKPKRIRMFKLQDDTIFCRTIHLNNREEGTVITLERCKKLHTILFKKRWILQKISSRTILCKTKHSMHQKRRPTCLLTNSGLTRKSHNLIAKVFSLNKNYHSKCQVSIVKQDCKLAWQIVTNANL